MFQYPRPDMKYDESLMMDFVPVHKFVKTERFQKYCDDKENFLELVNSNGHSESSQYIHQLINEINGDKQRFHDQSETTLVADQSTKFLSGDCRQGNNSTHNQTNQFQEQSIIIDVVKRGDDS